MRLMATEAGETSWVIPPLQPGDLTMYQGKPYCLVEVDRHGFFTLVDGEGESVIVHQSYPDFGDVYSRVLAAIIGHELY